jgi:sulfur carrier protein
MHARFGRALAKTRRLELWGRIRFNHVAPGGRRQETDLTGEATLQLKIVVNGEPMATAAETLLGLIDELDLKEARVATARNGDFVPAHARAGTRLEAGDKIEIVSPRHGG